MITEKNNTSPKSGKSEAEKNNRRTYSLESIMALQKALEKGIDPQHFPENSDRCEVNPDSQKAMFSTGKLRPTMVWIDRSVSLGWRRLVRLLLRRNKSRRTSGGLR